MTGVQTCALPIYTDYAKQVGELVRSQVLTQAAQYAVLAARDIQAQTVLALIKGQSGGQPASKKPSNGIGL